MADKEYDVYNELQDENIWNLTDIAYGKAGILNEQLGRTTGGQLQIKDINPGMSGFDKVFYGAAAHFAYPNIAVDKNTFEVKDLIYDLQKINRKEPLSLDSALGHEIIHSLEGVGQSGRAMTDEEEYRHNTISHARLNPKQDSHWDNKKWEDVRAPYEAFNHYPELSRWLLQEGYEKGMSFPPGHYTHALKNPREFMAVDPTWQKKLIDLYRRDIIDDFEGTIYEGMTRPSQRVLSDGRKVRYSNRHQGDTNVTDIVKALELSHNYADALEGLGQGSGLTDEELRYHKGPRLDFMNEFLQMPEGEGYGIKHEFYKNTDYRKPRSLEKRAVLDKMDKDSPLEDFDALNYTPENVSVNADNTFFNNLFGKQY